MEAAMMKILCLIVPLCIGLAASEPGRSVGSAEPKVNLYFATPILEGTDLTMYCKFWGEQNSSIYQVKWYRGQREIFRYTPREAPNKKLFPFSTVIIDERQSDVEKLALKKVPMAMRGNVSCEVSWLPNFVTITVTKLLTVVSPPEVKPSLQVDFDPPLNKSNKLGDGPVIVKRGDFLIANCTAGPASQAPNITFYINQDNYTVVNSGVRERREEVISNNNRTEIRTATLRLELVNAHFTPEYGKLKIRVRCEATLFNLYKNSSESFEYEQYREPVTPIYSYRGPGDPYGRNGASALGYEEGALGYYGTCSILGTVLGAMLFHSLAFSS